MTEKIQKLGLGNNEQIVALAAIKTGKSSKIFSKGNKDSSFYCHICKTAEVLKIHKIVFLDGIKEDEQTYEFSLAS